MVSITSGAATTRPPLQALPVVELSGLEPAVREQIEAVKASLEAALGAAEAGAAAELWGELGRVYHAYGFQDAARGTYENAALLAPEDGRWPYYLGVLHQQTGALGDAERELLRALEVRQGDRPSRHHLAEVRIAASRFAEAEKLLRGLLAEDPKDVAAKAALGQLALGPGRFAEAEAELSAVLELMPAANRLHYPLAQAKKGLGREDEARHHLAQVGPVGVKPVDPLMEDLTDLTRGERTHLLRGRLAFQAGRFGEAAEAFRQALVADPTSVRARVNLASALAEGGDPGAAIEMFEQALAADPGNTAAHFNLGRLLAARGDLSGAGFHLNAAAELDPRDRTALFELGRVFAAQGAWASALESFRAILVVAPLDVEARLGEASMLVELGRWREAYERLDEANGLDPSEGRVALALARLLAASPDTETRDGARALGLAQRIWEAREAYPHAEAMALALAELGRCAEAADWLEKAIELARGEGATDALARLAAELAQTEAGPPCNNWGAAAAEAPPRTEQPGR